MCKNIVVKVRNEKFCENRSSDSRAVPCRQTDKLTDLLAYGLKDGKTEVERLLVAFRYCCRKSY
jgi:hypothetical protein